MISHSKPFIGLEEINAASRVLLSGHLNTGDEALKLEKLIAADSGYHEAIAVPSASLGIYIILKSLYPKGKAKVAISSYICRSVWDAICLADCIPELVDIDSDTFCIDQNKVLELQPDVVIIAHMFGIRGHFDKLRYAGIVVIEDCAQRITPTYIKNEINASWKIYSFDPTKIITCGQGGMILGLNSIQLLDIRNTISGSYNYKENCIKAPFTDLQASIAIEQWKKLNSLLETRKKIAKYYIEQLERYNLGHLIHESMLRDDTWTFRFILRVDSIDTIVNQMLKSDVICRRPVSPCGLHQLFNVPGFFSATEKALDEIISIPIYPMLTEKEQEHIIFSFIRSYE